MSRGRMRWAAVLVPAGAVTGACIVDEWRELTTAAVPILTLIHPLGLVLFVVVFAALMFRRIDRLADELQARRDRETRSLAVNEERERIARDMHDGFTQILGYVSVKAQAVEALLAVEQTDAARTQLAELSVAARSVYVDIRQTILGLTSPADVERDLAGALEEYTARFADAAKIAATVQASPSVRALRLPPPVQAAVVHIVQEALTNVRKHAAASRTSLGLDLADHALCVTVEDNGVGFDPAAPPAASDWPCFGMRSMRQRAATIGARAEWSTRPGAGTTFRLTVPLASDSGAADLQLVGRGLTA